MFDEMYFLFGQSPKIKNKNNTPPGNNIAGKVADLKNPTQSQKNVEDVDSKGNPIKNNYIINLSGIKDNYIKSEVNKLTENLEKNPYLQLLETFNGQNGTQSMKINSEDLVYLKELGVHPINKMVILRRYAEGAYITDDLTKTSAKPIATIIGWIKSDTELLNLSFNENWITQGSDKMLHKLITDIISNEFGISVDKLIPIPGWGLGFMFDFLSGKESSESILNPRWKNSLPIGNPNVIKESVTRDHESFGLSSTFSFTLETSYEQKMIGDIDPTASVMEILNNLLVMGTSDALPIGNIGSKLLQELKQANENSDSADAWIKLITDLVKDFSSRIAGIAEQVKSLSGLKTNLNDTKDSKGSNGTSGTEAIGKFFGSEFVKDILSSTIGRYTWPLRGSIAMFTGENVTPWHITIGNPSAPFFSMGNVLCTVSVSYGTEMGYNDMPKYTNVKIDIKQGRSRGKNEIYRCFGIKYDRSYSKIKK